MVDTNPEHTEPIVIENKNETLKTEDTVNEEPVTESLKTLKDNAYKSFENTYQIQRFQRLNFLIEQTTLYSNFLSQKLIDHTQERAKLLEENPNLDDYVQTSTGSKKRGRPARNNNKQSKNAKPESVPVARNGQPALITGACLREYQLEGMQWLISLYENGLNGILADEMGLGKTIQTIALIAYLVEKKVKGPFIVIAPLSTIANWINEFTRFTPSIEVILYYGTKDERNMIRKQSLLTPKSSYPVIITSYEVAMSDRRVLQNINWKYMVVDECQRIKNFNCKLVNDLKKYNTDNRLLLTGTPLQNNLNELWSLLNFLLPDVFNDMDSFVDWFDFSDLRQEEGDELILDKEKQNNIISKLHHILKPFLLRRIKADVEKMLPKKREYILYANLTEPQRVLYEASVNRRMREYLMEKAKKEGKDTSQVKVFKNTSTLNTCMQLRKICNHPALCDIQVNPETNEIIYDLDTLVSSSGKMMLLDRLLDDLLSKGHRVLIFSQFTTVLDILATYLIDIKKLNCYRIDGNVTQEDRRDMIDDYQKNSNVKVFLLSTRSGGLGINLTGADTCIIFDSDWNPQMDLQAQDRCHRIGQTKPVIVYRLITANTIESHLIKTASSKRKLEKLVIHRNKFKGLGNVNAVSNASYIQELEYILKTQDYEKVIIKPGDQVISEEELVRITDRSEAAYESVDTGSGDAFEVYETKFEEDSFVMNPEDPTYSPDDSEGKTEELNLDTVSENLDEEVVSQ